MLTQLEVKLMTSFIKWPFRHNTDRDKPNTKSDKKVKLTKNRCLSTVMLGAVVFCSSNVHGLWYPCALMFCSDNVHWRLCLCAVIFSSGNVHRRTYPCTVVMFCSDNVLRR